MQHNAKKYGEVIEWIPFDRLENVEYLAQGGFGIVYKAKWIDGYIVSWNNNEKSWKRRSQNRFVCLKNLDNSTAESAFLQEIKNQLKFRGKWAIALYGITKDPTKNEYMMVMQYALEGSLRKMLDNKFKELNWHDKIRILLHIAEGLSEMHKNHFVHKDFHSGNIVNDTLTKTYITDFGLCEQIFEKNPENICGVIPFLAPEIFNGKIYTQASDMFSLGMIMLEVFTSYPPFYNIPHDLSLIMSICNGLKPEIKCEVPQLLKDLMERCWNIDPRVHPTKNEYMMVMQYALEGSLRKMLDNKFKELNWHDKIRILLHIAEGLSEMHKNHFVHKDFHSGNIVNDTLTKTYITDFGLCEQIFEKNPENICGVIPFLAPEIFNGKIYTQASDMFSLGMIMLEVFTSYPPFYNIPHDLSLIMSICNGLKPEIKCEVPQLLKDLMERCWNIDPRVRPNAEELKNQLSKYLNYNEEDNDELEEQIEAANELNENFIQYDPSKMHPEAIYTSRLLPRLTKPEYDTFNSRQVDFKIPDNIGNVFHD
ncbi:hypothetical protein Glove_13g118 [Diversispora epigaea]|uniref:Protein kinase domain-containing protein n=1 Tax=Diversispora epigaea TaxID=1348612 RepID=A0A397JWC4_9GLOM|nr:hypothetical protein Glove_13g118 [Diversispora epigaea]